MNYIPYRGSGPAMTGSHCRPDRSDGRSGADLVGTSPAGTIKAYAIAAPTRASSAPDVPTVDEAGAPGLHMSLWYGFWAPPGTPAPIVKRLNAAVQDALADPEVRARLSTLGMEIPTREQQTAEALVAQQKADIAIWWPIIKAAGIKQQ
jgi:tripartite-type tricarboxylate transporter receptor subunit TctC